MLRGVSDAVGAAGLAPVAPPPLAFLLSTLELLLPLHAALAERMEAALAALHPPGQWKQLADRLASEVLRLAPFLSTYVDYCASFAHAIATLNDDQCDPRLRSAVHDVEQVLADLEFDDGAEDLDAPGAALLSYLIKPVQRLCQYPLLFRSIATAYAGADGGAARRRGSVAASCPRTGAEKAFYTLTVLENAVADVNEGVRRTQAVVALRMRLGNEWVQRLGPACTALL